MGQEITHEGLKPTDERVNAILENQNPKIRKEFKDIRSAYVSKYIKNFSHNIWPLRQLLRKDVEFLWMDE